jgi:hypothetical protein
MLEKYRKKAGTAKIVIVFGVVYIISQAIIGLILHDLGPVQFVKAQTTFSKAVYLELARNWQQNGLMSFYEKHFYFDFLHPLWYSVFLSALIGYALNRGSFPTRYNGLMLMPFVAAIMDLIENFCHLKFISNLDAVSQSMIIVSALAANIKWGLAGLSLLSAAILFGRYFSKRRHQPQ